MTMPPPDEKAIFNAARQLRSAEARRAYVEVSCRGDDTLRERIEALLHVLDEEQSFLNPPIEAFQTAFDVSVADAPGTVIGQYKLLERIGEGGFGVVFLADQQHPVRRKVALKVIKPGMDTRLVIARFEAERQALAMMDHPNIAHVLDGGETASGRPYFVMELVRGVPVTDFCDQNQLPVHQRLELFLAICQAVQHAHQKGIIHRDLKPSNALVTLHDGTPVVKVIDFGIAKAMGQKLTEKTLSTSFAHVVGTPLYMSPEQAEMSGLDIDTRTDIYALGVLLYELLTGATPFDRERLRTVAFDELRRIIREEEPAKPSARISMLGLAAATVTANRQSDPERLRRLLGGELDWIVMKCLEKDRTRRYATANGLARDIQRYLRNEPVEAGPPSAVYKLRKFLARNKTPVLAAALVLLALVVGMAGTIWGLVRADKAREQALKRLTQVHKATEILASVFQDLDPQAAEKEGETLYDLMGRRLGEAARQLEGEEVGDPLVVARLQHALGISLRELGHLQQAEGVLLKACQTRERLLGADDLDTAATKQELAMLYRAQGNYFTPAETLYKEAVAVRRAKLGADHRDTLKSQFHLAILYDSQGKYDEAETLHNEVLALRADKLGALDPDTLTSKYWLALLYRSKGKDKEAEALYQEVLAVRTATLGPKHLDTITVKGDLGILYCSQGKLGEAETLCKEALAVRTAKLSAHHPDTLNSQYHLAVVYHSQGKYGDAETLLKEVLAIRTTKLGADHPVTLRNKYALAELYRSQGKYGHAEPLYREVVAGRTTKLGADHPSTVSAMVTLAGVYRTMKKLDLSIPLFDETLKLKKAKFGPHSLSTLGAQANLGVNYRDAGRFNDAIPLLEEVYQKSGKHPELAWVGDTLLEVYGQAGKATEAIALATERLRIARNRFHAGSFPLAAALAAIGEALLEAKAYADAEPILRECLLIRQKKEADAWTTFDTQSLLGAALLGLKKYTEAETNLIQGYGGMKDRESQIPFHEKVRLAKDLERLVHLYDALDKKAEADKWRKELGERTIKPKVDVILDRP